MTWRTFTRGQLSSTLMHFVTHPAHPAQLIVCLGIDGGGGHGAAVAQGWLRGKSESAE